MADYIVHVVCPNPALDRLQTVREFRPFEVNRVTSVRSIPGGKGLIVGRAARRLGADVVVHGFVGGPVGQLIRRGCVEVGARDGHVEISGETRVTPVVIEESTGRSTVMNERGPDVTAAEQTALLAGLKADIRPGDVVVSTGSLPVGCSDDLHAQVVRNSVALGALALVDAHGSALGAVIDDLHGDPITGPVVVKPNAAELGDVLGLNLNATAAATAAVRTLAGSTGATFVLTLGAHGAVWAGDEVIVTDSPRVDTVNATGSGDSFLAGLAVALGRGDSPDAAMTLAAAMGAANAASLMPDVDPELVAALTGDVSVSRPSEVS